MVSFLIGMMFTAAVGGGIGGASIDSLFFSNFNTNNLPLIYILMGVVNFVNLLVVAGLIGSLPRSKLFRWLPVVIAAMLIGARFLLTLRHGWFFPVLYILKEVLNALQSVFLWGMAGALLDARQAKRLYPLLTAGGIAGAVVGSFSTPLLVRAFGTENLVLGWVVMSIATGFFVWRLIRLGQKHFGAEAGSLSGKRGAAALVAEIQQGYQYVSKSALMRWWSLAAVLFAVMWFSLLLPFTRAVSTEFPDTDKLTAFLGFFGGIQTISAFLVSIFLSNRLFARFGLLNMLLGFVLIYFGGFVALLFMPSFYIVVIARLVKMIWANSVADPAWNAVYNAIPPERREQARSFINAVPGQAGIIISGILLLIGAQTLQVENLYLIGLFASAVTLYVVWMCKRHYLNALDEALTNGYSSVFSNAGSLPMDAEAVRVVYASLRSNDPAVRRIAISMLPQTRTNRAIKVLVKALKDEDADVRLAALSALQDSASLPDPGPVSRLLKDSDPAIRAGAIQVLRTHFLDRPEVLLKVQPFLLDEETSVRAQAAVALALGGRAGEAEHMLDKLFAEKNVRTRLLVVRALKEAWSALHQREISRKLFGKAVIDSNPAIRRAALEIQHPAADQYLFVFLNALGDEDASVRLAAAQAVARAGADALPSVMERLRDAHYEDGALTALDLLPIDSITEQIRVYIKEQVKQAFHDRDMAVSLRPTREFERTALLSQALRMRAQSRAIAALRAMDLLIHDESITLAIQNIRSRKRLSYALEVLDNVHGAELVRPLIKLWEVTGTTFSEDEFPWDEVLQDPDAWVRACAAYAISRRRGRALLEQTAALDEDELVRETARQRLEGTDQMETLKTLTIMDRIVFLQKVALFKELPLEDLKRIAATAVEKFFPDGVYLANYGEMGNQMFITVSGVVRVVSESGEDIDESGMGEYVGEMSILSEEPRIASLIAKGDVRALCIGRDEFEEILRERPEVSLAVMRELCARLRNRT